MAKIICIEDEDDLREIIVEELVEAGYEVVEARDGREGLNAILAQKPDLVISDISMPNMNGYELLREIQSDEMRKKYPTYAEVPFIFLSALTDRNEVIEGMKLGADDYITKPVDFDILLARIKARLRQISKIRSKKSEDMKNIFILD